MYIAEYLRGKGHTLQREQALQEEEVKPLMVEASAYASTRLAEVETRTQVVHDIHGSAPPLE